MGLFKRKDPCAICGGVVKGLLSWKVEGRYVCDQCFGTVDLPKDAVNKMTLEEFCGYRKFREENALLKEKFNETQQIDFGWFDTKFVFDTVNRLLCMDKSLNKTIFEGKHIKSFTIKEDSELLFEGSASGLTRYVSTVPDRVNELAPRIDQMIAQRQMRRDMERMLDRMDDGVYNNSTSNTYSYGIDICAPFQNFNIEICLEHPYWEVITADRKGPEFDRDMPDIHNFLNDYEQEVMLMEELAEALMNIAYPDAPRQLINPSGQATVGNEISSSGVSVDPVQEIQRYKTLLDQGIITEEEFTAKKRQLLGL